MKSLKIDSCSFGTLVINGKPYTDDLIIHPDGKILKPWRRKRGHQLSMDDLRELIDEIVVAPASAPWFIELVQLAAERQGLANVVRSSRLLDPPVY